MKIFFLATLACYALASAPLLADEPLQRHGTVTEIGKTIQVEGGFTATLQSSSDSRAKDEALASFDLVATLPSGRGEWTVYVEGNLSPRHNGISEQIGEANVDAGSALDRDGAGRLQVSELHYSQSFGDNRFAVGLLNTACALDASEVANDETRQFLGSSFVNNPTIAFPDYALGTCIHFEEGGTRPGFTLVLTSSHGLADNPNHSYAELVDIGAKDKGLFLAGELYGHAHNNHWRLGVWSNTVEQAALDDPAKQKDNYGVYLTSDHRFEHSTLNLRIGMANEDVSEAAGFVGLALETPLAGHIVGAGLAETIASRKAGGDKDNIIQTEIYMRFDLHDRLHITPAIQHIVNRGFDSTANNLDKGITVYSLRAGYHF